MENEEEYINSMHKIVDRFTKKYSIMCWVFLVFSISHMIPAIMKGINGSFSSYIFLFFSGLYTGAAMSLMLFVKLERDKIRQEYKDKDRRLREQVEENLNRL